MAVRIRMTRIGRTNRPFFRIGVYESRTRRNGRCLENLGWLDPLSKDPNKELSLNIERACHWLSVGATPTHKTKQLLKKAGVNLPPKPASVKK